MTAAAIQGVFALRYAHRTASGVVVPGHDPRVTHRYPAVAGTADLVHDLTAPPPAPRPEGDLHARVQR